MSNDGLGSNPQAGGFSLSAIALAVAGVINSALTPYALEILQPQAGLDTKNRFYKAYPGIEYNVSVAAVGGLYPYTYELTTAPSGMVVNANTGVISWPSPGADVTPYDATIKVTDVLGGTVSTSWTVLVTTDGFLFADFLNGSTLGTGTIGDPVKDVVDIYGGTTYDDKYTTDNQNKFVYFRGGAGQDYTIDGYTEGNPGVQWTFRKPLVMMAYPSEVPTFDFKDQYFFGEALLHNLYIEGWNIPEISKVSSAGSDHFAFKFDGNANNTTFRNNTFNNLITSTGSSNQACIMFRDTAPQGVNSAIIGNTFTNIHHGYGMIGYATKDILIGDNVFDSFDDPEGQFSSHGIGPKVDCTRWTIRGNALTNMDVDGIWLYYSTIRAGVEYGDFEVSFNYSQGVQAFSFNQKQYNVPLPSYIFRNTFVGEVKFYGISSILSAVELTDNVIINVTSDVTFTDSLTPEQITQTDNLKGDAADNIVDSNGDLTVGYSSQIGSVGWQV